MAKANRISRTVPRVGAKCCGVVSIRTDGKHDKELHSDVRKLKRIHGKAIFGRVIKAAFTQAVRAQLAAEQ